MDPDHPGFRGLMTIILISWVSVKNAWQKSGLDNFRTGEADNYILQTFTWRTKSSPLRVHNIVALAIHWYFMDMESLTLLMFWRSLTLQSEELTFQKQARKEQYDQLWILAPNWFVGKVISKKISE